jgi:hypothetical protein
LHPLGPRGAIVTVSRRKRHERDVIDLKVSGEVAEFGFNSGALSSRAPGICRVVDTM